jgi:hypothetical protein
MTDYTPSKQEKPEEIEEIEYEYIAPELARLYASEDESQLDGIYQADSYQISGVGTNVALVKDG